MDDLMLNSQQHAKLATKAVSLYYGSFQALRNVTIEIPECNITAIIGPSGCGKSSLLRLFNRMNDQIPGVRVEGKVLLDGSSIYEKDTDVVLLRKRVGMVFQKPNPFPMSIYDNITFGPRRHGITHKEELAEIVERTLNQVALWQEVKHKLKQSAFALSGGQQQRLCIARAMAISPSILLMDEPASALDPISTAKVEELIRQLKKDYTVIIVTHNMQQAARVSDKTAYFYLGEMIEYGETKKIFTNPEKESTQKYITGRFG